VRLPRVSLLRVWFPLWEFSAPPYNPFNPKSLISHLTNSNGCGNLYLRLRCQCPRFSPSFLPGCIAFPPPIDFLVLCFHPFTSCSFRNPFVLLTICVAPWFCAVALNPLPTSCLLSAPTALFTHCCKLLVAAKKVNSFAIKQIQTTYAKYPGWGILWNP
jgi:hypothetical protein